MLIDDNEIDNLINQKMIEAAVVAENIYTHTSAKSAIEFLRNVEDGRPPAVDWSAFSKYSAREMTRKLAAVFNRAIDKHG